MGYSNPQLSNAHVETPQRDPSCWAQGHFCAFLAASSSHSPQMRVAFITYGTQGTPLVCKNFFTELPPVMAALREDTTKLGIGQTTYGGSMGMAALEGFVAALEVRLFSIRTTRTDHSSAVRYIEAGRATEESAVPYRAAHYPRRCRYTGRLGAPSMQLLPYAGFRYMGFFTIRNEEGASQSQMLSVPPH